jgi:predicted acetyltransferase
MMRKMMIELTRASRQDTPVLRRLYELYCHDFSEFTHSDVSDEGLYTDDLFLTGYWRDPGWASFLVTVDGRLAGFAWVLKMTLFRPGDGETELLDQAGLLEGEHMLMEEFFILRKYRRQGIGQHVAQQLFDRFPGVWEVSEMVENTPAQAFWRKVIARYTAGRFVEVQLDTDLWRGPVQVFRTVGAPFTGAPFIGGGDSGSEL